MTTFWEIYVSSFWAWAGITLGAYVVISALALLVAAIRGVK